MNFKEMVANAFGVTENVILSEPETKKNMDKIIDMIKGHINVIRAEKDNTCNENVIDIKIVDIKSDLQALKELKNNYLHIHKCDVSLYEDYINKISQKLEGLYYAERGTK